MSTVSFFGRVSAAEQSLPPASARDGAFITTRGGRLSGRPGCRIYPVGGGWGLELERKSAWLVGLPLPGEFRFFKWLTAAIAFAEAHGLDYRIIRPTALFGSRRRAAAGAGHLRGCRHRRSSTSSTSS
jgi:hypothetical protein